MGTGVTSADEALRKAEQGEPLSVNDQWAIHRRLLHLRNAIDFGITDDPRGSRALLDRFSQVLAGAR